MCAAESTSQPKRGVVGTSTPTLEAAEKVTGRTLYVADLDVPDLAHAKILRSPYPHARIVAIDASAARALPGVVCVLTRDEVLGDASIEHVYGFVYRDAPLVALDKVRHQGDIVAVVVAEDVGTAEEALELIDVQYEELPFVMDANEAMQPGASLVHEQFFPIAPELAPVEGTNICHRATLVRGDVEAGFREADVVYEDTYHAPPVQHCALELHACIASVTDVDITVWTNCQSPFPLKRELERMFKLPARVIVPYVGGGFGSKSRDRLECVVTAAARLAKRPVKLVLTQEETFQTFIRPEYTCTIKTGVKRDGTIVARHLRFVVDVGGYAISGARSANNTIKVATGPYRVPNALVECFAVYTNKPPSAPYRGLPTTQHTMAYETQLDRIARDLDIDRVQIRLKNMVEDGDIHVTGDYLRSTHAKECLERVADALDWPAPTQRKNADTGAHVGAPLAAPPPRAPLRGKGVSSTIKYTLTPPRRMSENSAEVALRDDGAFEVRIGTVNIGQGSDTTMAQIAAEALGLPLRAMRVVHSDTGLVPVDSSTTASRSTYHMGNAVVEAAGKLKDDILQTASHLLEQEADSLGLAEEGVVASGVPERTLPYGELLSRSGKSFAAVGDCEVGGTFVGPDGTEYPIASTFWTFASAGAEVEVDPDTGHVRVTKLAAAANVGTAVNPKSVETQLEGGPSMELGPTLFERLAWDDGGQLLTGTLMDYPLPTTETTPEYRPIIVEHPYPGGPFGAKGMGEIGAVVVPAAVINAVYDATGVLFHEVPLLPHKVLEALDGRLKTEG